MGIICFEKEKFPESETREPAANFEKQPMMPKLLQVPMCLRLKHLKHNMVCCAPSRINLSSSSRCLRRILCLKKLICLKFSTGMTQQIRKI